MMKQMSAWTLALCAFFTAAAAGADMNKTAPALPASAGSKAEVAINEGMAHYDKGHWDVAKKHFQEAVQADERSAEAHYDLALALDKSGDHKAAIEHFKAAQDLGKDNPQIQNSGILQAHLKAKH
jgi:Tfp pilus assembly protein PilF